MGSFLYKMLRENILKHVFLDYFLLFVSSLVLIFLLFHSITASLAHHLRWCRTRCVPHYVLTGDCCAATQYLLSLRSGRHPGGCGPLEQTGIRRAVDHVSHGAVVWAETVVWCWWRCAAEAQEFMVGAAVQVECWAGCGGTEVVAEAELTAAGQRAGLALWPDDVVILVLLFIPLHHDGGWVADVCRRRRCGCSRGAVHRQNGSLHSENVKGAWHQLCVWMQQGWRWRWKLEEVSLRVTELVGHGGGGRKQRGGWSTVVEYGADLRWVVGLEVHAGDVTSFTIVPVRLKKNVDINIFNNFIGINILLLIEFTRYSGTVTLTFGIFTK